MLTLKSRTKIFAGKYSKMHMRSKLSNENYMKNFLEEKGHSPDKYYQVIFLMPSLKEFITNTTSLNAITPAPKVGERKPAAATGMATTL